MRTTQRLGAVLPLMALVAIALPACGSGSHQALRNSGADGGASDTASSPVPAGTSGGTVSMVEGAFPQSLDPGDDYSLEGAEVNWVVYTGLTSYHHASGTLGDQLIPGLAQALPRISDHGLTYTAYLRPGLRYSNGVPVEATDFVYASERAVKLPWGGAGEFMTPIVKGAAAFANGKAKTISGIVADDRTGKITIHLTAPYGAFDNVLAEPALGLIPAESRPFKNDPLNPPPGDGPYMVRNIVPKRSYSVVRNPNWRPLPGIPAGRVNIDVRVSSNVAANASEVLNDTADVFDWTDTIPVSLLPQIRSEASNRYKLVDLGGSTYYFFLNSREKPFNHQLAREAVVTGLNEQVLDREGSGMMAPACFLLPPDVPGHPRSASCPYGTPGTGNLAKAKRLVSRSGMAGQKVTVWSQARAPRRQWMATYTHYLDQLGFRANEKLITDKRYFATIGRLKLHPQTGFLHWNQDFPSPIDFYGVLIDGHAILPTSNENVGEVNDPHLNAEVAKLGKVPTTRLQTDDAAWQRVDEYTARKAYVAVFGYEKFPFFVSSRIDYRALVMQPIYGWDLTSFELK